MIRTSACLSVIILAPILGAGCMAPPEENPFIGFDAIRFTWVDDGRERPRVLDQDRRMDIKAGIGSAAANDQTDEGYDFRLQLRVWPGPDLGVLKYDQQVSREGTFGFQYEESQFWSGRSILAAGTVAPESTLEVTHWDEHEGRFRASFHLIFTGEGVDAYPVELRDGSIR